MYQKRTIYVSTWSLQTLINKSLDIMNAVKKFKHHITKMAFRPQISWFKPFGLQGVSSVSVSGEGDVVIEAIVMLY